MTKSARVKLAGLKRKRDGSVIVSTKSHVRAANERIAFLEDQIEKQVAPLAAEKEILVDAVDRYVLDKFEPGSGYEDESVKITKVVSHRRYWNPEKLRKILPTSMYKLVIQASVDGAKIDELVREGKIDRDKIESAFEEIPNTPYVKRSAKNDKEDRSAEEAAGLAAALG